MVQSPGRMELGQAPREVYPLVVVMVRSGSQLAAQPGQVTALVNIIHLKDDTCPIPSQVLSVYIRQGPSLTLLRQMFLSDGENSDTESAEERSCPWAPTSSVWAMWGSLWSSRGAGEEGPYRSLCGR